MLEIPENMTQRDPSVRYISTSKVQGVATDLKILVQASQKNAMDWNFNVLNKSAENWAKMQILTQWLRAEA